MALDNDTRSKVLAAADGLADELVQTVSEMVQINTVNPYAGDDSVGDGEMPGQLDFDGRLKAAGFSTTMFEPPADVYAQAKMIGPAGRSWKNRPNVVGELALGDGTGPTLVLNCHMDTVGASDMTVDPFSGEVRDGAVWGRGTSDSKGNLAAGLVAVRAAVASGVPLNGRILFQSVVDEECNGGGAGTVACCLAGYRGDAAICLDGSGNTPITGCNGVLTVELIAHGRGGHAAWGAVNAIDLARRLADAMDVLKAQRESADEPTGVNLGVFRAGSIPAVVPGEATMAYNLTYTVAEAEASRQQHGQWGAALLREEIQRLINGAADADEWMAEHRPTVTWVKDLFAFSTPPDAEILHVVCDAHQAVVGQPARPRPMKAWSDACHLSLAGIPTINYGSGTDRTAHTAEEHATVENLTTGMKVIALAIANCLGG